MSSNENQNQDEQKVDGIPVFLPDHLKAVSFSNNINAHFAAEEFAIDFLNMNSTGGAFVARVALTPSHMKRFAKVLEDQVKRYEEMFGEIPENIEPKK
ncbi:DUF3467 domain-containing protein [Shewanella algidipiscicola]|uniref:DUF3467 domain-containing protein n=1 Tax=Shewanella algidipiscicola TaxID=614070 RepID=A0ABQ4P844_9GAMM|nr:DUF3467 domain-containing protein [Shewanella algidipiscicola]GIU43717.1 hypothetical protein TUM4630_07720 [Shewanella algidipiscicola]